MLSYLPKNILHRRLRLLLVVYTMLWWACAQVVPLTGGDKDKDPPRLDSLKSTPNFQLNFQDKEFQLTFDEWIELKDVFNQVVVSPPLKGGNPEVTLRKKTVTVNLGEEDLREDATYIVNFGEAVKDYTQGNVVPDLRFVFSTGDYIDSLELSGTVVDAFTGKPVEKCLFMLYDNLSDTVVRKDIPFYFSRTDDQGRFRLQNIKADTFKTFVLLSEDPNYIYDQSNEKIGFLDSFAVVTDSTKLNLKVRLFQENPRLKVKNKEKGTYGFYRIAYNQIPYEAEISQEDIGQRIVRQMEGDSIKLWYHWTSDESWRFFLRQDTLFDTLTIDTTGRAAFLATSQLRPQKPWPEQAEPINPTKRLSFAFRRPLQAIDTSRVFLLEDTLKTRVYPNLSIDSLDRRKLHLQYDWQPGLAYQFTLLPGALSDIYNLTSDTLTQQYMSQSADDFGIFTINLSQLDSLNQYVFYLLKKDRTVAERILLGESAYQFRFEGLGLGKDYSVRMVEDLLPNGRWDTGSYNEKRQPERVKSFSLQELRANFEAEENIVVEF